MRVHFDAVPGCPIKAWTGDMDIEDSAMKQLFNVSHMPFIHKHIAVMPDVHWGMGCTVGSVIPTKGAVIPAAVGVDIGCGMIAQRTSLTASDLPDNLSALRAEIERVIPHGRTHNGGPGDRGAWHDIPRAVAVCVEDIANAGGWDRMQEYNPDLFTGRNPWTLERIARHLGTLGTGNHFVEVCLDEEQRVWVMLHSGSRGFGNRIGTHFIEKAKKDMRRWFINLPDADLAYIPEGSAEFDDYLFAVEWAQQYAALNRELMMRAALGAVDAIVPRPPIRPWLGPVDNITVVNCHHNYVSRENHFGENVILTRKGAVSARAGQLGIIPGSMGVKSFIVRGLGNPESFCSCSHGAGRKMSRGEAKRTFTVEDHIKATEGVECRKDAEVIDETPGAYKDIDAVMAAQSDLVEVVHTLKQVLCVKG